MERATITRNILVSLLAMFLLALIMPSGAMAQYGQVLGTYGQVLSAESPEEVTIVHEVKAAGVGDIFNPVALAGASLVLGGAVLYVDRKKRTVLKDFDFVR